MNRRILAAALAAAALVACKKSSSGTTFGLSQASSITVFWGYGHLHPQTRWPYAALANSQHDELILFDAVEDRVVPAPILLRPLSIPEPFPRPALVASTEFSAASDPAAPSLLVAVAAGSTQLQLVRTWTDPGGMLDPAMASEAPVDLGSPVLSMIAVPTSANQARVLAALADGTLASVDYQWSPVDPAATTPTYRITRVAAAGSPPEVLDLKFQALSLAVDANPPAGATPFLYAATVDPLPASGGGTVHGVAQIDMSGADVASWPVTPIDAGAPTRLVAALTLRERKAGPEGAYDQVSDPDGTRASFEDQPVSRVYAWRDPASCGPRTAVTCGIAVLDPATLGLATAPFLSPAEKNFPITVPSNPVALVAVKPPARVIGDEANTLEQANVFTAIDGGGWRLTGGVLAIPAENGFVYVADLSRWEVPSSDKVADGSSTSTGVGSFTPSSASSRRIGLYLPSAVADADQKNQTTGRPTWTASASAAGYIFTTPGFTPADTWTITYQGYLPDFAGSRMVEVEPDSTTPGSETYRVAFQAHVVGGTGTQVTQVMDVYDGAHGVRVGDIVEFWTGPTPVVDEVTGTLCPDTTVYAGDSPTPPIEGKVTRIDPPDDAHRGGSLIVQRGDCVSILEGTKTRCDLSGHGPWIAESSTRPGKPGCWPALATPQVSGAARPGTLLARIRAGGGAVDAEEFVVVGAATGYAGRAKATPQSAVTGPVETPTFTFTSANEADLAKAWDACAAAAVPAPECRDVKEQLGIARRARRTHLTSIACPQSSLAVGYCQTYFPQFDRTSLAGSSTATFPVPAGRPTLAFSVGLTCFEEAGVSACPPGEGTTRALVRDTQASFYTRSGWNPAARYGGGSNGGAATSPTGAVAFDRSNPDWGRQSDRYRVFVPYVDNVVLDVTGAQSNGDTRVLR